MFFRFLGYFGVGWPPCRRFDPPPHTKKSVATPLILASGLMRSIAICKDGMSYDTRHVARISPRGGGGAPQKGPFPSVERAPSRALKGPHSRALKGPHSRALKGPHSRALKGPSRTDEKVGYKGGECSKVGICHGPYQLWPGSYQLLEAEVNNHKGLPYQLWNQQ